MRRTLSFLFLLNYCRKADYIAFISALVPLQSVMLTVSSFVAVLGASQTNEPKAASKQKWTGLGGIFWLSLVSSIHRSSRLVPF